ncbi:oligosaccharide flippase family protein [Crocosphaera sp.]|uniref:oligosaccharide flippase family protein n=1 Tax=Crocosphaera sp. TaxID=2729996 RepID=UPI003F24F7DE|nr:oligosaccharide flippase family protein [Crocosphaera sp.]
MSSIKKKAITGTLWTVAGYGTSQILKLGGNIILTRLLVPELFGLMALMNTFIMGLNLFSDIGIRPSIIRSSRGDDPVFLNTAWTLQVIRGFILWLGCCIIAWPVAQFYGNFQLMWLLPIIGTTTILSGFNSTSLATLNRKIEINRLTKFEITQQFLSLSITIVWAYFQRAIWALVGGSLIGGLIKMIGSYRLDTSLSHRFLLDKESVKELISFGRWIFISTAMTFFANQADRLILGKLFSLEMLGIYTIAFNLAFMPRQILQKISTNVIFPVISTYIDIPREELKAKIAKKRQLVLIILAVFLTIMVNTGDIFINLVYDERYTEAAWMMPILTVGMWPFMLHNSINKILFALNKPVYVALGNFVKTLYMFTLIPVATYFAGALGAIVVIAFNDLPSYIIINYGLWREKVLMLRQDIQATLILFIMLSLTMTIRVMLGFSFPLHNPTF